MILNFLWIEITHEEKYLAGKYIVDQESLYSGRTVENCKVFRRPHRSMTYRPLQFNTVSTTSPFKWRQVTTKVIDLI